MKAFEKAKLALREHLLQNKQKVVADLIEMREKSDGNDIFEYVKNLSGAYSLSNLTTSKEVVYDYSFDDTDYYSLFNEIKDHSFYVPPPEILFDSNSKKDSETSSGSFFLLILLHVKSKRRSIFL